MGDMDEQECRLVELLAEMKQEEAPGPAKRTLDEGRDPLRALAGETPDTSAGRARPLIKQGPGEVPRALSSRRACRSHLAR
jgi:hypothetical protein